MVSLVAETLTMTKGGATIVDALSLSLGPTGSVAVVGPNGAGKSSSLKLLAGVERPSAGRVLLEGKDLAHIPFKARARLIGYLPQAFEPYWDLSAGQLLELGAERGGGASAEAIEAATAEHELEALLPRRWSTLSGGERSRVLLATVLVVDPPVLLADEPTAALDIQHRLALVERLAARGRERLSVVVMHDIDLALRFFERIVVIDRGRIVADGSAAALTQDRRLDETFGVTFERLGHPGGVVLHPISRTPV